MQRTGRRDRQWIAVGIGIVGQHRDRDRTILRRCRTVVDRGRCVVDGYDIDPARRDRTGQRIVRERHGQYALRRIGRIGRVAVPDGAQRGVIVRLAAIAAQRDHDPAILDRPDGRRDIGWQRADGEDVAGLIIGQRHRRGGDRVDVHRVGDHDVSVDHGYAGAILGKGEVRVVAGSSAVVAIEVEPRNADIDWIGIQEVGIAILIELRLRRQRVGRQRIGQVERRNLRPVERRGRFRRDREGRVGVLVLRTRCGDAVERGGEGDVADPLAREIGKVIGRRADRLAAVRVTTDPIDVRNREPDGGR